jgi:DNA/RNA endonuclease YhcR with UshA esterase domain
MIDHRKLLILVIAVSLAGVLSLFLYSTTIEPISASIEEIDEGLIGNIVKTRGMITYARTLSDNSLSIKLSNVTSEASITVYIPNDVYGSWTGGNLTPGTHVEVLGEVELYGETLEISVSSVEDITVESTSEINTLELWQILESLEVLDNMNLTTSGTIFDLVVIESSGEVIGTSFDISAGHENKTYSLDCIIFDQDISTDYAEWDVINVTGKLGFYKYKGCWQLVVEDIERLE